MSNEWPPGTKQNPRGTDAVPTLGEQMHELKALVGKLESELRHETGRDRERKEGQLMEAEKKIKTLESMERKTGGFARELKRAVDTEFPKWKEGIDAAEEKEWAAAERVVQDRSKKGQAIDRGYTPGVVNPYLKARTGHLRELLASAPPAERAKTMETMVNLRTRAERLAAQPASEDEVAGKRRRREMDEIRDRIEGLLRDAGSKYGIAPRPFEAPRAEAVTDGSPSRRAERPTQTQPQEQHEAVSVPEQAVVEEAGAEAPKERPAAAEAKPDRPAKREREAREPEAARAPEPSPGENAPRRTPAEKALDRSDEHLDKAKSKLDALIAKYGKKESGAKGPDAVKGPASMPTPEAGATAPAALAPEAGATAGTLPSSRDITAPVVAVAGAEVGRVTASAAKAAAQEQGYYRPEASRILREGMPFGGAKTQQSVQERDVDNSIVKSKLKFDSAIMDRAYVLPQKEGAGAAATPTPEATQEKAVIEPVRALDIESLLNGDLDNIGETAQAEANRYYDELTARVSWISPLQRDLNRLRGDIGYTARELQEATRQGKRNKLIEQLKREAKEMSEIGAMLMDQAGIREAAETGATYTPVGKSPEESLAEFDEKEKSQKKKKRLFMAGGGLLAGIAAFFAVHNNSSESHKNQAPGSKYEQVDREKGSAPGSGAKHENGPAAKQGVEGAAEVQVKLTEADVTRPHGAEEALQRLKESLKKTYGDVAKPENPKNVNMILNSKNPHNLAILFGFYNKATGDSSAMYAGDAFKMDSHGVLTFTSVDHPKGAVITLLDAAGNAKNIDSLKRKPLPFVPYQAHLNAQGHNVRVTYNQPGNPMQRITREPATTAGEAAVQTAPAPRAQRVRAEAAPATAPRAETVRTQAPVADDAGDFTTLDDFGTPRQNQAVPGNRTRQAPQSAPQSSDADDFTTLGAR